MGLCGCFYEPAKARYGLAPDFLVERLIGRGSQGVALLADDAETGETVALKMVPLTAEPWKLDILAREISLMATIGSRHVNLIAAKEAVLTPTYMGVSMEYMAGGTLFNYVQKHVINEDEACYFFRQLVSALNFLHTCKVAYRDVKLENTLLDTSNPPLLKLCDFGLAKTFKKLDCPLFNTVAGTPGYMSPQVLGGIVNSKGCVIYDAAKADVWGAGVLLLWMLTRQFPYGFNNLAQIVGSDSAMRSLLALSASQCWQEATSLKRSLSLPLRDLLDQMLNPVEHERITMAQVMRHPWFNRALPHLYQHQLDNLAKRQAALDAHALPLSSSDSHHSTAAVETLLRLAFQRRFALGQRSPPVGRGNVRLDLSKGAAIAKSIPDPGRCSVRASHPSATLPPIAVSARAAADACMNVVSSTGLSLLGSKGKVDVALPFPDTSGLDCVGLLDTAHDDAVHQESTSDRMDAHCSVGQNTEQVDVLPSKGKAADVNVANSSKFSGNDSPEGQQVVSARRRRRSISSLRRAASDPSALLPLERLL